MDGIVVVVVSFVGMNMGFPKTTVVGMGLGQKK
jgi:hypothetical protein